MKYKNQMLIRHNVYIILRRDGKTETKRQKHKIDSLRKTQEQWRCAKKKAETNN